MGLAKLIALLMLLLLIGGSVVGLILYFIKYLDQINNTQ